MHQDRPELRKRPANFVPLTPISFLKRAAAFFADRPALIHGDYGLHNVLFAPVPLSYRTFTV